jgi:hypothetical protein
MSRYLASWETCWKCPSPLSRQSQTRRCMFVNVTCRKSSLIATTSLRIFVPSSCTVRGLLTYTFPFNASHSQAELGQEIFDGHKSFEIIRSPRNFWFQWCFHVRCDTWHHPVESSSFGPRSHQFDSQICCMFHSCTFITCWDIRIFRSLVRKESLCMTLQI